MNYVWAGVIIIKIQPNVLLHEIRMKQNFGLVQLVKGQYYDTLVYDGFGHICTIIEKNTILLLYASLWTNQPIEHNTQFFNSIYSILCRTTWRRDVMQWTLLILQMCFELSVWCVPPPCCMWWKINLHWFKILGKYNFLAAIIVGECEILMSTLSEAGSTYETTMIGETYGEPWWQGCAKFVGIGWICFNCCDCDIVSPRGWQKE